MNRVWRISVVFMIIGGLGLGTCCSVGVAQNGQEENRSSVEILISTWEALKNEDIEEVIRLTDQCVKLYGKRARLMQKALGGYVEGENAVIRSQWALNDVATALYIKGKALQEAGDMDGAKTAYRTLLEEYRYGQCWDPKGWFWKPALVAEDNLKMLETGKTYDFGDYASSTLVIKGWEALEQEDLEQVLVYTQKCIDLYGKRAKAMQEKLEDYPKGSDEELFGYWALNDVATARFIQGRAYQLDGQDDKAVEAFKIIREEYPFAQCWDPRGWWWKVANEAGNWLDVLEDKSEKVSREETGKNF